MFRENEKLFMEPFPSSKQVKKIILREVGTHCPDFEPTCYVCQMWRAFESYCWLIEEIQREQKINKATVHRLKRARKEHLQGKIKPLSSLS